MSELVTTIPNYAYRHVQGSPSAVWVITHNLGFMPGGVTVIDSAGSLVDGEPAYSDLNTLVLSFYSAGQPSPFSGTVVVPTGIGQQVRFELTAAQTGLLLGGQTHAFDVEATLADLSIVTIVLGTSYVLKDVTVAA